ncbi:rRNA maturation RNase YbeY [Roseovarius salinarum]|uniref:rRNA maturation RNase YbeY n=1 Tax=Roseovarius salinarum TaxID=1981892 RepID=UPI000C3301AE|nr:rRNA maturation RNase YbeY [Roseovarius salinarum]
MAEHGLSTRPCDGAFGDGPAPGAVETVIEDDRWRDADLPALAGRAAAAALQHLGLDPADFEIVVLGCDDARIAALNADFRGRERPTNVLSWPSAERAATEDGGMPRPPEAGEAAELGDIAISYDTCLQEARAAGTPLEDHVMHLVVHAVLHLLGYDHERDRDATLMERTETVILGKLGVPDPYR